MKLTSKACKKVEELYKLRKIEEPLETNKYQIFQAPFYYLLAHIHTCYIEEKADALGNLEPIDFECEETKSNENQDEFEEGNEN